MKMNILTLAFTRFLLKTFFVERRSLFTQLKFWWCPKSSNMMRHCL